MRGLLTNRVGPSRASHGHTLLEVLLALGLSLVLLGAAYSALDLYRRSSITGQQEMERLQVTRALFDRLSRDIRGVVSGHAFVGEPNELLLSVSDHALTVPREHNSGTVAAQTKFQQIFWAIGKAEKSNDDGVGTGLARLARHQIPLHSQSGSLTPVDGFRQEDILAPEVTFIRFRYFDGTSWLDRWNSGEMQQLPRAVEIAINFAAKADSNQQEEDGEHRLVISVPSWESAG